MYVASTDQSLGLHTSEGYTLQISSPHSSIEVRPRQGSSTDDAHASRRPPDTGSPKADTGYECFWRPACAGVFLTAGGESRPGGQLCSHRAAKQQAPHSRVRCSCMSCGASESNACWWLAAETYPCLIRTCNARDDQPCICHPATCASPTRCLPTLHHLPVSLCRLPRRYDMTLNHAEEEGDGLLDIDDVRDSKEMDVSPAQDLDEGAGTTAHHTSCGKSAWLVSTGRASCLYKQ